MAPSPINLVTTWVVYLLRMCERGIEMHHHGNSLRNVFSSGKKGKVGDYSKVNDGIGSKNGKSKEDHSFYGKKLGK